MSGSNSWCYAVRFYLDCLVAFGHAEWWIASFDQATIPILSSDHNDIPNSTINRVWVDHQAGMGGWQLPMEGDIKNFLADPIFGSFSAGECASAYGALASSSRLPWAEPVSRQQSRLGGSDSSLGRFESLIAHPLTRRVLFSAASGRRG